MTGRTTGRRGSGKPTIADVAALAGVSVSAVSKVVNGRGGISAPTRQRVLDAAAKLRWSPSATAVALRGARTRALGMVAGRSSDVLATDPHFTLLISGIESELAPADYGLLLHIVGEEPGAEERAYRRLAEERRVDGVILTESRIGDGRFELLRSLRLPAVLVGAPWQPDPVVSVQAGGQDAGIRAAVDHLVTLGHRRIAYVSGPEDRVHTVFRRRVFETALAERGLRPGRVLVSEFTAQSAVAAVRELLADAPDRRPTAVLFANDTMAVAGMNAARRLGFEVPRDLSVIGYDDLPLGELVYPQLTTVHQDLIQLGRAAVAAMFRQLDADRDEESPTPVPDPEVNPPELVIRESTGPAREG
ncbi:LacI family DNA-binding transcriptional regulator [Streptomyces litchfieldiae]|uniref:LacI family DNA-binding transcriptional regulator n=1 Tax=Streptomyces litchfieldiae TaxID=3075543 RepID=A0ABU2N1X4_9ACTN|nr:LacI family DNA-binding transcriptional regulator [Streptomyces sp. DSM 44938]MDT0347607.1 LacI family DNA-binding transcriptional regulator [Streptomyces sp. DSM 44938]